MFRGRGRVRDDVVDYFNTFQIIELTGWTLAELESHTPTFIGSFMAYLNAKAEHEKKLSRK